MLLMRSFPQMLIHSHSDSHGTQYLTMNYILELNEPSFRLYTSEHDAMTRDPCCVLRRETAGDMPPRLL
jgi:hypothetical protein